MNNPPPPPNPLYGGIPGQFPPSALQPPGFLYGQLPPLSTFNSKYQPSSGLLPPPMYSTNALLPAGTSNPPPPPSGSGNQALKPGGFSPFGSLPFGTPGIPSFNPANVNSNQFGSSKQKRGREDEEEDEEDEEDEEEEEEDSMPSFKSPPLQLPPPPTANLRSATAPAVPQFMPTQQYAKQPPPPSKMMSTPQPSIVATTSTKPPPPLPSSSSNNSSSTNTATTSTTSSDSKSKPKKQPKPKKSKKDTQASSSSSNNNSTSSSNQHHHESSINSTTNTLSTLPPVANVYSPFIGIGNALFGNELMCDENIRKLGHFICTLNERENIELEGKIGFLILKDRKARMSSQLVNGSVFLSEVIIHRSKDIEFQSRISPEVFKYVNNMLNERYSSLQDLTKKKQYNGPVITYGRCNETDKFFEYYLPPSDDDIRNEEGELDHRDIRVTFDTESDKPIRAMIKSRIDNGDIDFACPHRVHDFRVSFRKEKKIDRFPDLSVDKPKKIRKKCRISYTFGICRIDLTSVESFNCNKNGDPIESTKLTTHEIEVECDTKVIMQAKSRLFDFVNYLKEFLDIVRMLCLVCEQSTPPQPPPTGITPQQQRLHNLPPPVPMVANSSNSSSGSGSSRPPHQQHNHYSQHHSQQHSQQHGYHPTSHYQPSQQHQRR